MPVNPIVSSHTDAIIRIDEICDAVNLLPELERRLMVAALKERSPVYAWTVQWDGRLTCRHDVEPPVLTPMMRAKVLDDGEDDL